jgi:hypothetical protein
LLNSTNKSGYLNYDVSRPTAEVLLISSLNLRLKIQIIALFIINTGLQNN